MAVQGSAVLLLFIIAFAVGIIGWGSPAVPANSCPSTSPSPCLTKVQSGTGSVVLTNALTASTTVTFSPAYSTVPNFKLLQTSVAAPPTVLYQTSAIAFVSLSSTGQTWTSMPGGTTELFGDQNHELWADLTSATSAILEVNCPTASTSLSSPYLSVQYSTDGTTWNYLDAGSGTVLRVFIDGSNILGNCQIGPFPAVSNSGIAASIVAGGLGKVFLRIIGVGGGGVGDNPVFTEIHLLIFSNITVACNYGTAPLGLTASQAVVKVSCSVKVTFTYSFQWIAGVAA